MELNKNMMQKTVLALVLLAVAALSAFVVSERVSAPEYHKASMEALEEKKITVMEMTAAVAASSIAVDYMFSDYRNCPICKEGKKLDALINPYGYSKL